ncbi:hypothetical protein BDZ94DRAFT_995454 [Collybia nuda]|uniref:RBR-type E3 ubiquitin transferase n=1 Tax=Collybia nuda TaxID=64659 RepID=A0A9P6CG91_9AGAR|nr:hypothetical protein BDZ94DRAFT_995454 [Collybia nuda]
MKLLISTLEAEETLTLFTSYPTCGICLEPFKVAHSPFNASVSANSSSRLPFGLRLPCPCEHSYCISCLTTYIQSKLDPEGIGSGKSAAIVFPIRCPECLLNDWPGGMTDDVAERILGENGMVQWHHQKLLDSIPRLFCPNPKCSSLVEADEDNDDPQAICPSCQKTICASCRTLWHNGLTCEEYQALPLDERSPEDRLLLELAKAERWRRCPSCAVIVELISGCNHMTCRCGFHFCFQCGSPATTGGLCTRKPPCELWEEDMLLEARERRPRNDIVPAGARAPVPLPALAVAADWFQPELNRPDINLEWMFNPHVLCGRHWFTTHMISNLTCGYCNAPSNSLADLRYHLEHVQHHEVYACCGRFFKRIVDFERHQESPMGRFGGRHAFRTNSEDE